MWFWVAAWGGVVERSCGLVRQRVGEPRGGMPSRARALPGEARREPLFVRRGAPAERAARAQGEQSTWAKLSAIQANCGIETTLDACMVAASRQVAERRAAGARVRGSRGRLAAPAKRARCPSWVNMSIGA